MTFKLGLTGSIGMGKSTTAQMFADAGVPVWDADAVVHKIYGKGGTGVEAISALFPEAIVGGIVSRERLKSIIAADDTALDQIERAIHPLVAADRAGFVAQQPAPLILFDIPLLFETGAHEWLDAIVVVSVPEEVQRDRVLARPGMTEAQLDAILSRQMSDADKRARADYVIETTSLEAARQEVEDLIAKLTDQPDA